MKKMIYLAALTGLFLAVACKNADYKKGKKGLVYQVFNTGKGAESKIGNVVKFHIVYKINDSLVYDSHSLLPNYQMVDTAAVGFPEALLKVKAGDSISSSLPADTIISQFGPQPGFKKGDQLHWYVKVIEVFSDVNAAQADYDKEMETVKAKEIVAVKDYVAKNNINATQTAKGVFVEVQTPGTGPKADSGKQVKVMYTGKLFNGTPFDSNRDTTISPNTQPLVFVVGTGQMIPGFDDGVKMFSKGGKGRIFMPSTLGYGGQKQGKIEPFSNLMFEIEVIDVADAPKRPAMQQMPDMEQHGPNDGHNHGADTTKKNK